MTTQQGVMEYEQVEKLIYRTVHRFHNRYGTDFDGLVSRANLVYLQAIGSYDPSKSTKFSTWLASLLNWELTIYVQKELKSPAQLEFEDSFEARKSKLDDLSEDGDTVLRLAVSAPSWAGDKRRRTKAIAWITQKLKEDLQWSAERIAESFAEIRTALQ